MTKIAEPQQPQIERRHLPVVELRMVSTDDGGHILTGHAPPWNSLSVMLWRDWESELPVHERFLPGAFTEYLASGEVDVKCLFNHRRDFIVGRTPDTLELSEDDIGLFFRCHLAPTTWGKDLAVSIDRGDVRGASFAFGLYDWDTDQRYIWPRDTGGVDGMIIREISKAYLDDVSPVTDPAYEDSQIELAKRSLDQFRPQTFDKAAADARQRDLDLALAESEF